MPDSATAAREDVEGRTSGSLIRRSWEHFLSFAIPFFFDVAIGSLIFAAMFWFGFIAHQAQAWGMDKEHAQAFQTAHFWFNYLLFVVMGLLFLVRIIRQSSQESRH